MAAHLRSMNLKCYGGNFNCPKRAEVTLHNWRNVEINQFCRKHGQEALKRLQADDKAECEAAHT